MLLLLSFYLNTVVMMVMTMVKMVKMVMVFFPKSCLPRSGISNNGVSPISLQPSQRFMRSRW